MNQVEVSDISTLNFREDWKLDFQQQVSFVPKFLPSDPMQIQYTLYSAEIKTFLRNESDNSILELSGTLILNDESFKVYNLKIDNYNVNQDTCFTLFFARTKDDEPLLSSCFEICMELPGTVLLKYTNKRNEKGVIFSGVDPFCFRINGVFLPQEDSFENESENFRDQRFTLKSLSSNIIEKKTLTIGAHFGVPNWVARKINLIFSLSAVWVDGISMARSDGSSVEITLLHNDYPLYIYKIILEESIPVVYDGDIISEIDYARVVDEKKKILRKSSESNIRVYSESSKSSIENALMIRELELIYEISEYYTIEIDDNVSGSTKKTSIYSVIKLFSKYFLSKVDPDTALGLIKFLGGLDFGEVLRSLGAVDSFISGKGTILTKDGRIQTDRLEVRNSMKVLEFIINRIQGMENDFVFAPTRKVVNVDKLDETTYKLVLDPLRDGDLIPFREGNILYSIVNDLLAGGNSYYTSYMRVLTTNQNEYSITVSLYPDSEVPGGQNHIPVTGYNISRRGDVRLPEEGQSNPDAQSWYLSSTEGRLLFLHNVIKPVLDDYNYALSVGKFPRIQAIDNLPISTDDVGIMAKTIVCEKLYRYDYNGDIISNKVDRGEWSLPVAMSSNPYRFIRHEKVYPDGIHQYTELEQHTVYHHGCKWGCLVDKTTEEPRWNARSWVLLEGDKNYILTFESSNGWQYRLNQVETDIKAVVVYANQDISDNLFVTTGVEVEWLRDTGNVASDNSWKPAYVGGKKNVIHLMSADMGSGWGAEYRKVSFVCRVFIPAGEDYQRIENRINIKL